MTLIVFRMNFKLSNLKKKFKHFKHCHFIQSFEMSRKAKSTLVIELSPDGFVEKTDYTNSWVESHNF